MYLQLNCKNCEAAIPAKNINVIHTIAKCEQCNVVFNFDPTVNRGSRSTAVVEQKSNKTKLRAEVTMPPNIEVLKLSSQLDIDVKWQQDGYWGLIVFAVIWNACVLPVAIGMIVSGNFTALIFLSLHLTVGLGLIYFIAAIKLNTTYIAVNERSIEVKHRPLPTFIKNRQIDADEIEQLYCIEYVQSKTNGMPNYAYHVMAITKHQKPVKLIPALSTAEQALYIEQEMERFLQIVDKAVPDELLR